MKKKLFFPILIIAIFLGTIYWMTYSPLNSSVKEEIIFTIEKGEGVKEIAQNLESKGLINLAPVFCGYVLIAGASGKLQAGTYLLSPSEMNIPDIVKKFTAGDIAKEKLTFPEGFNADQIYQRLSGVTEANLTDLKGHEGYLFPDTYEIPYRISSQEIIKIMTDNFDKKTAGLESEIAKQGKTINDVVIMASLLEREVKTKEEKELAAGLLWKRLRAGMPLQVDVSPETYERRGLPENPICSPGLESITAAVYPKASQYWYYLSTPEGKTIFSKTLKEHNIARAKYLI
ncbi:MAG: endolytic transglycosylase MltG [Patescibacteria group bacterium]